VLTYHVSLIIALLHSHVQAELLGLCKVVEAAGGRVEDADLTLVPFLVPTRGSSAAAKRLKHKSFGKTFADYSRW
jgi:hypothetical protein